MKKHNWLQENIASIIALILIIFGISIDILVLMKEIKATESTAITIVQNINNMMLVVIGFYFVSSIKGKQDEKNKDQANEISITNTNSGPSN